MSEKYLTISGLGKTVDEVFGCDETVVDALYSLFKESYKMSLSTHFRGDTADRVKEYISSGPINCINGLMNVSNEIVAITQMMAAMFNAYETSKKGVISLDALNYIQTELKKKRNIAEGTRSELNAVLKKAAAYISTTPLKLDTLVDEFDNASQKTANIANTIMDMDDEALKWADELYDRCVNLKASITNLQKHCYSGGTLDLNNVDTMKGQNWYNHEGNIALNIKLAEDPFKYSADEVTVSENQWAAGLFSDVYAYAGYSFLHAGYESGLENGKYYVAASASVLSANLYAQATDYVKAKADVKAVYGEGSASTGFSKDYAGVRLSGEVGLFKAEGSVVVGSDDLNGYVKGTVKVMTAEGDVAFEFEDDGEFAIGVKGEATTASASGKIGVNIFSYTYKESVDAKPEKLGLLSGSIEPKASGGGSFALWAESKTAIETPIANINATTIEVEAVLGIGGKISVTVPTININWPWEW